MAGYRAEQNYYGRQLQRELRRLRIEAGFTLEEAGLRAHIDLKKLSRLEIHQLPTYHELVILLDVYGVVCTEARQYLDLWQLARQQSWWRRYTRHDNRYLCMEDKAAAKTEFQLGFLPTLLQTELYAYKSLGRVADREVRDNLVAVRMRQQQRLFSADHPLSLRALVHQPALCQGVDKAQLSYLVECSELPNVTFQIVSHSRGMHLGLRGSAILLTFDDGKEPDTVFTETHFGLSEAQEPERVSAIKCVLDHVTEHALSPADSTALLHKMIAGHR
nr:helix-turn-helix transcriptional regulator [Kibdelosporangium sp. MJ126-NF4]CEL14630.1 Putative DNA-binding protein [Kibdelosporangium sp. MJ126-NF4]CTQ96741.1 Putative DNA-binding protein [Kibdelosporangium sp. MJ126-NF4]